MSRFYLIRPALLAVGMLVLAGCGKPPASSAYLNRGGPESLLDVSSELVNLHITHKSELHELSRWIKKDQPTRAELHCALGDTHCAEAEKILRARNIPVIAKGTGEGSVTLIYERILARDCNASYRDNTINDYNTNHASFGCAVASNMTQHVTDKQQFTRPNLSDVPSAKRAVNDVNRAYTPRAIVQPYSTSDSAVGNAKTSN